MGQKQLIHLIPLCLILLLAGEAHAVTTPIYFRINGGVRTMSTTAPTELANCGASTGCDLITAGGAFICSGGARQTPLAPITIYNYVVPSSWSKDNSANDTKFVYSAKNWDDISFTQPKIKVTYKYNNAGNDTYSELMGTPCTCNVSPKPNGCDLDNSVIITTFDKIKGGNIPNVTVQKGGTLALTGLAQVLPAGSTIMVEVWVAEGQATAAFYSTTSYQSNIMIPYAANNFSVYGSVTPKYVQEYAGSPVTITYRLKTDVSAPPVSRMDITIPGHIGNTTEFFDAVAVVGVSQPSAITSVLQATAADDGKLTVDFSAQPVQPNSIVTVVFTANAPASSIQDILWNASVNTTLGSYPLSEEVAEDQFMAVLGMPAVQTGVGVVPINQTGGGGRLQVTWPVLGGAILYGQGGITSYEVWRDGSYLTTCLPSGSLALTDSTWKPKTAFVSKIPQPYFNDSGLTNGTSFCYQIKAVNAIGKGPLSVSVCGIPFAAPVPPVSLTVRAADQAMGLSWTPSVAGTYPVSGYLVWRSSCTLCTPLTATTVWGATSSSFLDSGLSNGALYTYQVLAFDCNFNFGALGTADSGRPAANPPTGLSALYDYFGAGMSLSWVKSPASKNEFSIDGYNIYRATCSFCITWSLLAGPPAVNAATTVYLDTAVTDSEVCRYMLTTKTTQAEGPLTAPVRGMVPPAAPSALTVLSQPSATLYLEWASNNIAGRVNGYRLYRTTVSGNKWLIASTSPPGQATTSYLDTGTTFGQRYYYRVSAWCQNGADWAESLPTPEYEKEVEPAHLVTLAIAPWDAEARLSWFDLRPDQVVDSYQIYRSTQALITTTVFVTAVSTTQYGWLTYYDDTVTNGNSYYYWISGKNAGGEGDLTPFPAIIPFKPPIAPAFLSATGGVNRVGLVWAPSVVGTYGLQGYEVLSSNISGLETLLATLSSSASTYTHSGLLNGTRYYYVVRAFDFNGNRGTASPEANAAPALPPCAPTAITAVAATSWVETSWPIVYPAACSATSSFPVGGYYLYKSTYISGGYVSATKLDGASSTGYFDSDITPGQTYYYRVWTFDDQTPPNLTNEFYTGYAPIADATPRVPAGPPGSLVINYGQYEHDGRLQLSWVASAPGTLAVIGYRLYRSTADDVPATATIFVSGAATQSYLDAGLSNGNYYHYHLVAVDEKWLNGVDASVSGTPYRDPLVPTGLTAIEGNTVINLQWTAPASWTTFPVSGYQVYRATYPGIIGLTPIAVAPPGSSGLADPGLVNGVTYYYHLRTYDTALNLSWTFSGQASTAPYAPPQPPTGLSLTSGPSRITVKWSAPAAGTFPVSGYLVFRATYAAVPCALNPVQKVVASETWVDHMVTNGIDYYYSVAAFDTVAVSHLGPCSVTEMTTAGAPDPPSVPGALSGISGSMRAILSWIPSAPGTNPLAGYSVYRTTFTPNPADSIPPYADTTSATAGSYSDMAATDGIVYYYSVRARDNTANRSNFSNEVRMMASTPPTGLAGDVSMADQITLVWNVLADPTLSSPDARPVTGYVVYRSTVSAITGFIELARTINGTADPATTTYLDTTAIRGLPMYYRVSALYGDDMWEGNWSAPVAATAIGAPSKPGLSVSLTDTGASLTWVPSTSSVSPVTSYSVFRATTAGVIDGAAPQRAFVVNAVSYIDTGLTNGTFYYFQVAAYDKNSTSSYSDEVSIFPLGKPQSLSAYPENGRVGLAWALSPGGTTAIDGYEVYRVSAFDPETVVATIASGSASVFIDATVVNGITYTYRVRGFAGTPVQTHWSLFSNTVPATPASPPTAPNNPTAVASSGQVAVCWAVPTSPGTNPINGYRLYRSTGPGLGYNPIITVGPSTFCYTDTAVTNSTAANWRVYYYQVTAFDSGTPPVEGPPSNPVFGVPYYNPSPPLTLTTVPGNGFVQLVWLAPNNTTYPVTHYNIYRGIIANGESPAAINAVPTAATIYADAGRTNGTRYFYKVRSLDDQGHQSGTSIEISCVPFNPPGIPGSLTAHPGNGLVMLSWANSTAGTYPFVGYHIYRGSVSGGATTFVASTTSLKFVDGTGITATDYYYSVRAYDSQGNESNVFELAVSPNTTLVNPPLNVAAAPTSGTISVSWTWTSDGLAPGGPITEYAVVKATCALCPWSSSTYLGATASVWVDAFAVNGLTNRYTVRSVNSAIKESLDYVWFNEVSAVSAFRAPSAPQNLVATGGMGVVELKWAAPADPGTEAITAYAVLRNSPACPCSVTVATLSASAVAFMDTAVIDGVSYQYQVVPLIWLAGSYWRGAPAASNVVTPNLRTTDSFVSANAFAPARGDRLDITFTLDRKTDVKVGIYTITGIKVWETTMNGVPAGPSLGSYLVVGPDGMPGWDGKAKDKLLVASGVYLLRIETAGWKKTLKVIVIK